MPSPFQFLMHLLLLVALAATSMGHPAVNLPSAYSTNVSKVGAAFAPAATPTHSGHANETNHHRHAAPDHSVSAYGMAPNVDDVVPGFTGNNASLAVMHAAERHPYCARYTPGPILGARDCSTYLHALGSKPCAVKGYMQSTIFCQSLKVDGHPLYVYGVSMNFEDQSGAVSSCNDVALALDWIINNCEQGIVNIDPLVIGLAGAQAANGNGGLLVVVKGDYGAPDVPWETNPGSV